MRLFKSLWIKREGKKMKPTYNIYYELDGDNVGTLTELEDGDVSITINGSFAGVFKDFQSWNPGNYNVRKIPSSPNTEISWSTYSPTSSDLCGRIELFSSQDLIDFSGDLDFLEDDDVEDDLN